MGFKRLDTQRYSADEIADVVLRGRFGFRAGYKEKLAAPKAPTHRDPEGGASSPEPPMSAQEQETLLAAYLQNGTLPSGT